ncbi:MAG: 3-hydroxyacyl-ACP dehydratase FabZ [Chryseobacterium sp.]|uniref:3-hydroxyacyl-ACP dehydratase FabZ n=1 Tax=Chryseobacterium sp. TaxID=1871047 RepID=UPI0025C21F6A|nr:3-hydroxyacyl-ACP dehydratase FabZ [Chryseobacterium sp.]MCJ7934760.1 3-hydroxyacyl-ACP dehydratase FabZ [Chryseobacterium sp.]
MNNESNIIENEYKNIAARIPQRYPFLFVDRIIEVSKDKAVCIKNISLTDPYFVGHFPDEPIFPGVLLIEACAQVGGIMIAEHEEYSQRGYIAMLDKFKFIDFIVPGDTVFITCNLISLFGKFVKSSVEARVDNRIVGKGMITYNFKK